MLHIDKTNGNINDSWFFRDYETLENAAKHIAKDFPQGADILDYACSSGEESISIASLLSDKKYKVIGYDTSTDAIRLGKRGVYSLFSSWYDSYLIPDENLPLAQSVLENHSKEECLKMQNFRRVFHKIMKEIPESPQYKDINNKSSYTGLKYQIPNFTEKFYRLKDEFKDLVDLRLGNFINIGQIKKEKPVGAIFFRNAIYHLCNNNINEVFDYNAPSGAFRNKNILMEFLVNGIYKTLDKNGIFVLGNHIKEHLYWADETTPLQNTIHFCDTPFYNDRLTNHRKYKLIKCFKDSPLEQALLKDNRFEPVAFSFVKFGEKIKKVPVIWKKIGR